MPNQSAAKALYTRLEEVLGQEPARTLMELFPDQDELATRADLASLSQRIDALSEQIDSRFEQIDARFEKIDARFEKIDDRLYGFHETLRSYARTFIVAQTATVFGVSGIVFAIAQLM